SDAVPLPVDQRQADRGTNEGSLDHETQRMWQERQNRIEKLSAYRRRVIQCEKAFERSLARMRSVMTKIRTRPTAAVDEAKLLI
ncbi:DUF3391 domain-containing protein, partial [Escherichia coli]|nr:DUF3391 domain-containing protein [Escherichia coli]